MRERNKGKIWRLLSFIFLVFLFIGMTAASFALLYRYAEYGREASVNTADQETEKNGRKQASDFSETSDKKKNGFFKKLESGRTIRVQLLGNGYLTDYHETLAVTAQDDMIIRCGGKQVTIPAEKLFWICRSDETSAKPRKTDSEENILKDVRKNNKAALAAGQTLTIETDGREQPLILPELERGQKNPSYRGKLEIYGTEEGLMVVNELDLETYLQSVVSSEMPSSYPIQALCAQAVCARTYAVNCMEQSEGRKKTADLDDSISYQVYNNYPGDEWSRQAVDMTRGLVMNRSEVYYYSTSCLTEERTDLDQEKNFRKFLDILPDQDAEYGSPWVRWSVSLPKEQILDKLRELYDCTWVKLRRVSVCERNSEGQAESLLLSDGSKEITVEGEYQIRRVLDCTRSKILLRDGSEVENLRLLPSAYFYIQENEKESETSGEKQTDMSGKTGNEESDSIFICGGGYGHGNGMSQNGAAAMAQNGANYREILKYYYS